MSYILVADDNPLSLRFFAEALTTLGHACETVDDGAKALKRAYSSTFDLLLLDVRMPKLGAADALAHIRAGDGPSRAAVAIATTADNTADTRAALLAAGFAEVLPKPFAVDDLRSALARHLPARRGELEDHLPTPALDDTQAFAAAGGDLAIVAALRHLLADELDALPAEIAAIAAKHDVNALRDRLHRLDASAGFCGATALSAAATRLRAAVMMTPWPEAAVADFLHVCAQVRVLLS